LYVHTHVYITTRMRYSLFRWQFTDIFFHVSDI